MRAKYLLASLFPRNLVINIKYVQQWLNRCRNHRKLIETDRELISLSKPKTHVFFGYYDISPFNEKTDEIIYLNLSEGAEYVSIMKSNLYNVKDEKLLAKSSAWSWQQGIRLRWMPTNDREVIFNDFHDGKYVARIINVDSGEERVINAPIYDISPDGKFGLSVDFERLEAKRAGYGYSCRPYSEEGRNLSQEGIDLVNINNDTTERILTYEQIANACGDNNINFKDAYINHISFSPSGKKFLFFWIVIKGKKHKASLIVYDFNSKTIIPVETEDIVSHYVWDTDEKIICTAYNRDAECSYYEYSVADGQKVQLNCENLIEDGHPSLFKEDIILTDTYPNLDGYQQLFLAGKEDGKNVLLIIYSTCKKEGPQRTDLHPRLNLNKSIVCIDANVKGYRTLNFVRIEK